MIWENLKDTLVQTDLRAENEQEIFEQLGGVLVSEGYCKESYVKALSEREKVYPTGVLAGNIGVAIPHTDPCYVETTGIAIGVLKEPVSFFHMGTNPKENVKVPVKFVMMLAITGKQHLEVLQRAILLIQDAEILRTLVNAGNPEEIIQIINNKEDSL